MEDLGPWSSQLPTDGPDQVVLGSQDPWPWAEWLTHLWGEGAAWHCLNVFTGYSQFSLLQAYDPLPHSSW